MYSEYFSHYVLNSISLNTQDDFPYLAKTKLFHFHFQYMYIYRSRSLAKQGDNARGSVRPRSRS